jgi:hypothetical protein
LIKVFSQTAVKVFKTTSRFQQKTKGVKKMTVTLSKKILSTSILCIAMMTLLFHFPMTSFGQEVCPLDLRVEVSPYQVNIDAGGVAHYVRVLTYTSYSNTAKAFVYIDDNTLPIDPDNIELTRDSIGHLVVKIDLNALQDAALEAETIHFLKIAVVLKTSIDECLEKEGVGEIYIIGKKGY